MMQRFFTGLSALFTLVMLGSFPMASTAAADEEEHGHEDALVFQDGGQVQMGLIDVDCFSGAGEPGCSPNGEAASVFEAELEEITNGGTAEEPGFFAIPTGGESALPYGSVLPGNATQSLNMLTSPSALGVGESILYWDGSGSVSWSAVQNSEYFDIQGNTSGGILTGSTVLSGIDLDSTNSIGGFDTHPDFTLYGNSGTTDPTVGFYALFARTNIEGLTSSDKWAVVFGYGLEDEEAHEAAVDSLASVVPEPGTAILMGLGLAGLAASGRRRQS